MTDKEREAKIAELWRLIKFNESLSGPGAPPFDVNDTSTHRYSPSGGQFRYLFPEIDRLLRTGLLIALVVGMLAAIIAGVAIIRTW